MREYVIKTTFRDKETRLGFTELFICHGVDILEAVKKFKDKTQNMLIDKNLEIEQMEVTPIEKSNIII